jgi:hypothetical protein
MQPPTTGKHPEPNYFSPLDPISFLRTFSLPIRCVRGQIPCSPSLLAPFTRDTPLFLFFLFARTLLRISEVEDEAEVHLRPTDQILFSV